MMSVQVGVTELTALATAIVMIIVLFPELLHLPISPIRFSK